jgi:hypothetical protein
MKYIVQNTLDYHQTSVVAKKYAGGFFSTNHIMQHNGME